MAEQQLNILDPILAKGGLKNSDLTVGEEGGFTVRNDGKTYVYLENNDASVSLDVTLKATETVGGVAFTDKVLSIPAGEFLIITELPTLALGSLVTIELPASSEADISAMAFKIS